MNEEIKNVLLSLVETARQDNFNMDVVMPKFPELQQVDQNLLMSFVETARRDNYQMDMVFAKFPEITGIGQEDKEQTGEPGKAQDPTIFRGAPVVGLEKPGSGGEETKQEDIFLAGSPDDVPYDLLRGGTYIADDGTSVRTGDFWNQPLMELSKSGKSMTISLDDSGQPITSHIGKREEIFAKYGSYEAIMNAEDLDGRIKAQFKREMEQAQGLFDQQQGQPEGQKTSLEDIDKANKQREQDRREENAKFNAEDLLNKSALEVMKFYDDESKFPGLNVTDTSVFKGMSNHLTFELPNGESIDVDLGDHLNDNIRLREANKLRRVRAWYQERQDPNHPDYEKMFGSGFFRQLGERPDEFDKVSANFFEDDKLERLNASLKNANLSIVRVKPGGGSIEHGYKVVDTETGEVRYEVYKDMDKLTKGFGLANSVQSWFWNNLDSDQLNAVNDSSSELANYLITEQKRLRDIKYNSEENSAEVVANELKSNKEYEKKVIQALKLSEDLSNQELDDILLFLNTEFSYLIADTGRVSGKSWGKLTFSNKLEGINLALQENLSIEEALKQLGFAGIDGQYWVDLGGNQTGMRSSAYTYEVTNALGRNASDRPFVYEALSKILAPGETYNQIISQDVVNNERLSRASRFAQEQLGLWSTKVDNDGEYIITSGPLKDQKYNPEQAAAAIDNFKFDPNYAQTIGTRTATDEDPAFDVNGKPVNKAGIEVTFDQSFEAYKAESENMTIRWQKDQDALLKTIREAGLGYEQDDQGRLVIIGTDEDKVNEFQGKWNKLRREQYEEGKQFGNSFDALNNEWKTYWNDVHAVGNVVDREYDYGDLISYKFWGGWADMVDGIVAAPAGLVGITDSAATQRIVSRQKGQERLEQSYTFMDAFEEGLSMRYATMSMASQAANLTVAIGTQFIPGAGMWLAPALFGMSSGGQKTAELNQMIDAGEKATLALADLEKQYAAGNVSMGMYIQQKNSLQQTIALGDLEWWQISGAVGMAGVIEGGISYYLGTVPNSRAALKALTSVGDDVGKGIFRNNLVAFGDFLKASGKEMANEILEEELILIGDQLSTALITGKEMDISWETLTETAIQSIMISGVMNGSSNGYNTIATQWTSKESRKAYNEDKSRLNEINAALQNPKLTDNARNTLNAESARIMKKWGSEYAAETEILATIGGSANLKTLIQNNIVKNEIYQKAGIDPRDSDADINAKLETYKSTLSSDKRAQVESQLASVENNIADVQRKTNAKFNVDPLSDKGVVYQMYGQSGLDLARELAANNPEFNGLTNKEKTIAVHNEMKQRFDDQRMAETKQDKAAQRYVDMQVYGFQGGQQKTKKGTKRKRRKKAAEESAYRAYMSMGTYVGSNALIMASQNNVSAQQILSNEALKNTKFVEMGTTEAMIEYISDAKNMQDLGIKANELQDEVVGGRVVRKGIISKIKDGNIKALIGADGKAIAIDAEGANNRLAAGDMLQATAIMHETFHAQDSVAMTDTEIMQMAIGMHQDAQSNATLKRLSDKAIRHQVNNGLWDTSKRADQQSKEALDEYSKRFSEFIRADEKAMKAARKYGQGLGNKFNEMAGKFAGTKLGKKLGIDKSIGDFKFVDSKGNIISGAGMNYAMGFIDAFMNGEISLQTKRKIDAGGRLKDPSQVNDLTAKLSEESAKQVKQSAKQASNAVQEAYNDIQRKIEDGTLDGSEFVQLASMFESYVQGKVNKFRNRPKFKELRDDIVSRILYEDSRGVMGLMQSYNDNLGVPLAAYMFEQLAPRDRAGRIQEVVDAMLPETFETRLDTEEGTTDIVDLDQDVDFDLQEEMRASGVKIWERLGDAGLDIHTSIVNSVLAGEVDTDNKNYKTLKTPQAVYDAVFEMMGIEPKPGNLTKGDIKNAQRFLDKYLAEFRAAVPEHHTTKMVKGKDGKLEVRPDKAIGIPKVILEAMFNKGTRVDNLTPWHRKTDILDSEILSIFGITERGNPNLYKKESNTSSRIRAAAKLLADAMYNQGVRAGMDARGDSMADILAVGNGRSKVLFSEANVDMESFDALSIDELQEQMFDLDKIAADTGWMTPEFYEKAYANNISNEVIDFATYMGNGDKFSGVSERFKTPLKSRITNAEARETELLNLYFDKVAGTETAIAQTKESALALIEALPAEAVKAMGSAMFGLTGSSSRGGLGSVKPGTKNFRQEAVDVKKAYDEKVKQADPKNTEYADLAIMQGGKSPSPVFARIQKILQKPISADAKKALIDKEFQVVNDDGTITSGFEVLDNISAANKKALKLVLKAMASVPPSARVGVLRMLEAQTNNGGSTRGLTGLKAIEYLDGPQAIYSYKKNGETLYTDDAKKKNQKGVTDFGTNKKHPLYKPAKVYADAYAKSEGRSSSPPWGPDKIKAEAKKKLQDLLKLKGEHIDPSANVHRQFAEALLDTWYNGGDLSSSIDALVNGFDQSLGAKFLSDLQDEAFGTTSTLADLRLAALKGKNRVAPSRWQNVLKGNNKLTPAQYDKVLNMINIEAMQDVRGQMGISSIITQLNSDKQALQEMKEKFVEQRKQEAAKMQDTELGKGADVNEAIKLKNDTRKAAVMRSEETKGMTAWDFDDTLATTKSNVIFTKDGETKIISAEDFAKEGAGLVADGWTPDFSEFNKVTGGKPGPEFDKAMERAKKYGTKDTYILTARAPESAVAIKEFLDALGLNIPLENITGLGNSTGEAKARWLLDKHAQGYNDIAFVDDAMQNVEAVRKAFDEFDIKGKVEQARSKFSEVADNTVQEMLDETMGEIDNQFNTMLEQTKGVDKRKTFSAVKARQRGKNKGRFKFFLPPSAEDFKGLMYSFMGKGRQGEKHHKFIKETLFDPYTKGVRRLNSLQHEVSSDCLLYTSPSPRDRG